MPSIYPSDFPAIDSQRACKVDPRTNGGESAVYGQRGRLPCGERLIGEHEAGWELVVEIENVEVGVPDSIKQMIEKQIDHLDADEQRTLEAASVAGAEFSTLAVVAGLGEDQRLSKRGVINWRVIISLFRITVFKTYQMEKR